MNGLIVRTCLLIDFLFAIPVFALLIFVSPDRYAETVGQGGETIRARIRRYSGDPKRMGHGT